MLTNAMVNTVVAMVVHLLLLTIQLMNQKELPVFSVITESALSLSSEITLRSRLTNLSCCPTPLRSL